MSNEVEQTHEEIEFKEDTTNIEGELKETADEIAAKSAVNEVENSEEKLQKELSVMQDKYLRLYSEFENFKRRTTKERSDLFKTANQEVLVAMLPVLDDFERAIQAIVPTDENKSIKEGIELIHSKFKSTLVQKGIKEMDSIGKPFDSDIHEAITQIPAPSEDMKGKILDVLEKGYFLNDKVVRFAKVVIGA